MSIEDDDATQPVEVHDEPTAPVEIIEPITPREIEELRAGYEKNRRRSRLGLALGVIALLVVVVTAPLAGVFLVNESQQSDILEELRQQGERSNCRAVLAAATDTANTEFFAAIISRPFNQQRLDTSLATLNRLRELRADSDPCRAARSVGPIVALPPTGEEPTTTTTEPPPAPPPPSTRGQAAAVATTVPAAAASGSSEAPTPADQAPPDTRPGRRICLPVLGCIRVSAEGSSSPGQGPSHPVPSPRAQR